MAAVFRFFTGGRVSAEGGQGQFDAFVKGVGGQPGEVAVRTFFAFFLLVLFFIALFDYLLILL